MRIAVALAALLLGGCGSAAAKQSTERVGSDGVTVVLPAGWDSTGAADGAISDPVARVAVSSGPLPHRRTACQVTDYGPADDEVALVVLEWAPASDVALGKRPERFTAANLPADPGVIECFAGAGGSVQFAEAGRNFGAYLLLGRNAPAALADEARSVLDSLRVEDG